MASLEQEIKKMFDDTADAYKLACVLVSDEVISTTPVLRGDLRNSWHPTIGDPVPDNIYPSKNEQRRHDHSAVINDLTLEDSYSMANNQPHAQIIEDDIGHSEKGGGMLAKAEARFSAIADKAMRDKMK